MATNLVSKMGQNYLSPAFIAMSIQNGTGYRYLNGRVNSAIFSPYESALSADDTPVPCLPICQGTLPWQSIDFGKMS